MINEKAMRCFVFQSMCADSNRRVGADDDTKAIVDSRLCGKVKAVTLSGHSVARQTVRLGPCDHVPIWEMPDSRPVHAAGTCGYTPPCGLITFKSQSS